MYSTPQIERLGVTQLVDIRMAEEQARSHRLGAPSKGRTNSPCRPSGHPRGSSVYVSALLLLSIRPMPYFDSREGYERVCLATRAVHGTSGHKWPCYIEESLYKLLAPLRVPSSYQITRFLFHCLYLTLYMRCAMRENPTLLGEYSHSFEAHAYRLTSSGVGPTGSSDAARLH